MTSDQSHGSGINNWNHIKSSISIDRTKITRRCGESGKVSYRSYPVSKGHTLVIPKRHVSDYFDCTESEVAELWALVDKTKNRLQDIYAPDGFNIGVNVGEAAGQTVPHMHIHVIPRYVGDMDDPRGGVRGVIPNKQKY